MGATKPFKIVGFGPKGATNPYEIVKLWQGIQPNLMNLQGLGPGMIPSRLNS